MEPDLLARIEKAYRERWPMKEGKTRGMKKLAATLKTEADADAFLTAMDAYIFLRKQMGTPVQYWMRWHTFCNNWQDYLDPNVTTVKEVSDNRAQLERIIRGEL